jgi:hypothetical protein
MVCVAKLLCSPKHSGEPRQQSRSVVEVEAHKWTAPAVLLDVGVATLARHL